MFIGHDFVCYTCGVQEEEAEQLIEEVPYPAEGSCAKFGIIVEMRCLFANCRAGGMAARDPYGICCNHRGSQNAAGML